MITLQMNRKRIINRDYALSMHDDIERNLLPRIDKHSEASEVYTEQSDGKDVVTGWIIKGRYE